MSESRTPLAVAALIRKRAEIAGNIADLESQIAALRDDLLHVDHTLRLFDPNVEPRHIPPKHPQIRSDGYFGRGEITRRIYDALRGGQDVSAVDIVEIAMTAKTLPLDDKHLRATFTTRFLVRLNQLADKGTIERIGSGNGVRWRVASEA
jgi:hypothetical protein